MEARAAAESATAASESESETEEAIPVRLSGAAEVKAEMSTRRRAGVADMKKRTQTVAMAAPSTKDTSGLTLLMSPPFISSLVELTAGCRSLCLLLYVLGGLSSGSSGFVAAARCRRGAGRGGTRNGTRKGRDGRDGMGWDAEALFNTQGTWTGRWPQAKWRTGSQTKKTERKEMSRPGAGDAGRGR